MNKSTLVGAAMIAAAAVAMPVTMAWSADENMAGQSTANEQAAPKGPMADHMGGPMMHGEMGRMMRMMHGRMNMAPRQACIDRLARRAGFIAQIGFRLNLTAEQKPLWDKVLAANESAQDAQRKLCEALPASAEASGKETVIDRMNHWQQMLQARLQGLQQAEPAVKALYEKLTPAQKAILDHPFRRG
ncbi:MAG TPA: Spy/CpxP family protein refolding chaperone [Stellaceae bacterium]|nr:Spy/CpxP family protein refolding chaperone [Stellaceae bacterium]